MTWGRVFEDEDLDQLAKAWQVQLFCLGHRKVPTGVESEGIGLSWSTQTTMVLGPSLWT